MAVALAIGLALTHSSLRTGGLPPQGSVSIGAGHPTAILPTPAIRKPVQEALTRRDAVALLASSDPSARVRGIRQGPQGLVVCTEDCPPDSSAPSGFVLYTRDENGGEPGGITYNLSLVYKQDGEWGATMDTGGAADERPTPRGALVAVYDSQIQEAQRKWGYHVVGDKWVVVWGYTYAPQVAAVEVTFNTGTERKDRVTGGMYAVVAEASAACEVRALDANGRVLQRLNATNDARLKGAACE